MERAFGHGNRFPLATLALDSNSMTRTRAHFHPRQVQEIRNGYYWLAKDATGIGTTSFRVPEGNKHSTFDLIQSTVANQPTALTENGGAQFRMRKTGDAIGASIIGTSGSVTAGWTGQTYIAGWFRLPDASGALSTAGSFFFVHSNLTGDFTKFRTQLSGLLTGGNQRIRVVSSTNGTAAQNAQWANTFTGDWIWLEATILATSTISLFSNFVVQSRVDSNGLFPLFDTTAPLSVGCNKGFATASADTTDWCTCYYGNGIPSLKNRKRLANYLAPTAIKFNVAS